MKEKAILRQRMKEQRAQLAGEQKEKHDQAICQRLKDRLLERDAQIIHTFLPMGDEINIYPLIEDLLGDGFTLVAPQALPKRVMKNWVLHGLDRLEEGVFGTRHPLREQEYTGPYDLIILPGLAFDREMYRVGYGAGYYDLFLSQHPEAYKIGIAYPFQIVDKVPREAHDEQLDEVLY